MRCPTCNKEMKLKARDLTVGHGDKRYERTIYNCEDCDTWSTEEVPVSEG